MWCVLPKKENSQAIKNEFSNILATSKRSPLKIESDRGAGFYISVFQNFLRSYNLHQFSRFTDKGPSIAERVIRRIRSLFKKPLFLAGEASWINELLSVIKKYNTTIHSSTKMTPIQASKISKL